MDLLGLESLPFLARRNFFLEFKHLLFWAVLAGVVEGQFASVVVSKSFEGSELLIAIASATPLAALLVSLVWGMLCLGRPKIRLAIVFVTCTSLCAGAVGFIPSSRVGAIWFLCQMAAAQIMMAGVITVRSALWKSNYPESDRGRIVARLQSVRFIISVCTVLAAAAICDRDPTAYRFVYPAAALLGVASVFLLAKVHVRGERSALAHCRNPVADGYPRRGQIEPFSLTALLSPGRILGQMVRVLRNDRRFAWYCTAQFLMGASNFMVVPVLVAVITRELPIGDRWVFWIGTALIAALPRLTMLASLRRWGGLMDRLGVIRLRILNVGTWTASLLFGAAATFVVVSAGGPNGHNLVLAVVLFAGRSLLAGFSQGGGMLAWNIGHLHFVKGELAEVYMGIHVSLTGLRGILAPLLGMWLWTCIGWHVWLVAIASSLVSLTLYSILDRREKQSPPNVSKDGAAPVL